MSRASDQRWKARREASQSETIFRQTRRAELLVWQEDCAGCGCRLQGDNHHATDFACLQAETDRLYCRACIAAGVHLAQVENEVVL